VGNLSRARALTLARLFDHDRRLTDVAEPILADDHRHTTREDIRQAIQQRTTRGLLTFNTGRVHRLEGDVWAVPSTRGGFYQVDLGSEDCSCEDFTFYGQDHGVPCRHVYAAAIARASCRNGIQVRSIGIGGDPFACASAHEDVEAHYAALERLEAPHGCIEGVVYIGEMVIGDDGEEEVLHPVLCRRGAAQHGVL
jgi:hypothetical protein